MYSDRTRRRALSLLAAGRSLSWVSSTTGVSRSTLRAWRDHGDPGRRQCPTCDGVLLDHQAYAALLGFYLGDGCISAARRHFALRVSCDQTYPAIIADVERLVLAVRPGARVARVRAPGAVVVQANWKHWPCLFPQHGPGRKHERPIVLADWQRALVGEHPGAFLRGLFHSDGCRVANWATRTVAGHTKRYDYPRWQFTNHSADILQLCCWALDLVGIGWRRSSWKTISVSTRAGVAALDELIGPKQ